MTIITRALIVTSVLCLSACEGPEPPAAETAPAEAAPVKVDFAARVEGADIRVPAGFRATVFADNIGLARHIAVRDNGDVYVAVRQGRDGSAGSLVALRDGDGDGAADGVRRFGPEDVDTGLAIHDGKLWFASRVAVYAIPLDNERLIPTAEPELVVGGFLESSHAAKPMVFDNEGHIYINSGVPSNSCQQETRTAGSPGQQPCPELERFGGVWRFPANFRDQDQSEGSLYFTGIRQIVAMDWNQDSDALYFAMHGRDQLDSLWPDFYTAEERQELPAEEFHRASQGDNFGWPYTYWDPINERRMVAPEYGGDGETEAEAGLYKDPLIGFPAHWAPNDLIFLDGTGLPPEFDGAALIAFHGSWNRDPGPQGGFNVVFVPMADGEPAGDWEIFADGFAGEGASLPDSPRAAEFRPTGLAQGPDGSIYITDSRKGRVWRVTYEGS